MSAVVAVPDQLTQAATQVATIGHTLDAATRTTATSTQALLPAAADEVSAAVAHQFSRFGQDYQSAAKQASAYSQQFVQHLTTAADSYATAEAVNASLLQPAAAIPTLDKIFASLVSTVTGLFWQTLAYLYYLGFLLLIPIYAALALWLPVAFVGSLFGLAG